MRLKDAAAEISEWLDLIPQPSYLIQKAELNPEDEYVFTVQFEYDLQPTLFKVCEDGRILDMEENDLVHRYEKAFTEERCLREVNEFKRKLIRRYEKAFAAERYLQEIKEFKRKWLR